MVAVYWERSDECGSSGASGATLITQAHSQAIWWNGSDTDSAGVVAAPSVNAGRQLRPPGGVSWSMSVEGESEASATRKSPGYAARHGVADLKDLGTGQGAEGASEQQTTLLLPRLSPILCAAAAKGPGPTAGAARLSAVRGATDCAVGSG